MSYILENYSGVAPEPVVMNDDTYRVFDKPGENRMMVTPSIGAAGAQGFGRGLALGLVDTTPPSVRFEAAADRFLEEKGRPECKATRATLLVNPQYEVRYACAAKPAR